MRFDWVVVGAGFAGAVMAERLASKAGKTVLVVDRRHHIAGNAFDEYNDAGVLIHRYGPHIFHTNSKAIFEYLSRFTNWRFYEHRVLSNVHGNLVPFPININTINKLFGLNLDADGMTTFLAERAEPQREIRTAEDVVLAAVGRELYETFFKHYTRKQWGLDPSELDRQVTARIPVRANFDDRYFGDDFQFLPAAGYTSMFDKMLSHQNIAVALNIDYAYVKDTQREGLVYTGPLDEYFGCRFGKLPYRSLRFEHATLDQSEYQPVGVVNYPQGEPYTRITEYKHITGQQHEKTAITFEYPSAEGEPYYPIPRPDNQALFRRYEELSEKEPDTIFVGRLATYKYYNMDQVVGQALQTFRRKFENGHSDPRP